MPLREPGAPHRNATISSLQKHLTKLHVEAMRYANLNNGFKYLLLENVALIECVLDYLTYGSASLPAADASKISIADVRGAMLKNPVSRIVFCDYLGLHYLSKAGELIRASLCNEQIDNLYSADGANRLVAIDLEMGNVVRVCLSRALEGFAEAQEHADGSLLWKSYIQFNICRARYLQIACRIDESPEAAVGLCEFAEGMCSCRDDIFLLIENDVFGNESMDSGTYIRECFDIERIRASKLKKACEELRRLRAAECE